MKHLLIFTIISMAIIGCSPGNKPTELGSATEKSVVSDSTGVMGSSIEENTEAESETATDPDDKLGVLRIGMKEKEVIEILGKPTSRETIGSDGKTKAEDWWYGDNQKVRMINSEVNFVVKDVALQKELMKQLVVAKKNKDEAAAQRIMEELTKGQK